MRPQELAKLLQELDAALKRVAGTCEKCGKPKGGFVPAFVLAQCGGDKKRAKERVGLCVCSDAPQTEGR
jgi:hypothetical protein